MNTFQTPPHIGGAHEPDAPDRLPAGKLCFELANTINWHASEPPLESTSTYNDLVDWAQSKGVRSEESARKLKLQANLRPTLAEQVYDWAIDLREAIYRIFVAIAKEEPPDNTDLALLNEALPHAFTLPEV